MCHANYNANILWPALLMLAFCPDTWALNVTGDLVSMTITVLEVGRYCALPTTVTTAATGAAALGAASLTEDADDRLQTRVSLGADDVDRANKVRKLLSEAFVGADTGVNAAYISAFSAMERGEPNMTATSIT